MDIEAVKVLLETQERTFKTAIDIVVEQLQARLQIAEGTITDLIKSLEFSQNEVKDLQGEVKVLRKSDMDNKATIDFLKLNVEELERRANYQKDYNRRKNLRISGISEQQGGETWEETAKIVSDLLECKMELLSMKMERTYRTGLITASQPRTVVARFERFGDREAVIRNARKLKGTGIYINEDLCLASLELKKSQFPLMKKAREEGKIAFFRHTRLIIKERTAQRSRTASGEPSGTRDDGSRELRSAGAVGDGVEVRPEVEPAGVGIGGGAGAPSTTRTGAVLLHGLLFLRWVRQCLTLLLITPSLLVLARRWRLAVGLLVSVAVAWVLEAVQVSDRRLYETAGGNKCSFHVDSLLLLFSLFFSLKFNGNQ